MQFLTILLVNIFMGAVIYLLLSLKIARSSSEYREQRFKREMDSIIREFNVTADRNISILENRLNQLKYLLKETGDISSVDITVGDGPADNAGEEPAVSDEGNGHYPKSEPEAISPVTGSGKKGLPDYLLNAIDSLRSRVEKLAKSRVKTQLRVDRNVSSVNEVIQESDPYEKLIEKDLSSLDVRDISDEMSDVESEASNTTVSGCSDEVSESDILKVISESSDRFGSVLELESMGCSVEMISRYCNIPAGEVKLILNLQK